MSRSLKDTRAAPPAGARKARAEQIAFLLGNKDHF